MSISSGDDNGMIQTLEEQAEHDFICQKSFSSEKEWYKFFNKFGKVKGFSIRKSNVRHSKDHDGIVCRYFLCSRAGARLKKYINMTNRKRKHRPQTRCYCPAKLVIKLNEDTNEWVVHEYISKHNHEPAKPNEVVFLRSQRKITEYQKDEILGYQNAGLRKHQIMDVMEQQHGGYTKVGFVRTDLYNFSQNHKSRKILEGDATAVLRSMKQNQLKDLDFFFRYETNADGQLVNLFWCDGQSRLDYEAFGDVVIFDSTYRTNRYNMPFVPFVGLNHHRSTTIFACGIVLHENVESFEWLLRTFLMAMYCKEPRSVITDGDHAMRKAIKNVLPNSAHRLCTWHIERNIVRYLHHSMVRDFRNLIHQKGKPSEFVSRWKDFMTKYNIGEGKKCYKWLSQMYRIRKLWAASYVKKKYFLGAKTNQRSESLNSRLHKHLDRKMTLLDMVQHYYYCVSSIRKNESELDSIASQSVPVATTNHKHLEMDAAITFTPANFVLVQKEIERTSNYEIVKVLDNDVSIKYVIASIKGTRVFNVECDDDTAVNIKCSCLKFDTEGIPCCHIMLVLITLGVVIPRSCVLSRWTLNAKSSYPGDEQDYAGHNSDKQELFIELVAMAKEVFHEVCDSHEDFVRWKEMLTEEGKRKGIRYEVNCETDGGFQNRQDDETYTKVEEPPQVVGKGAPRKRPKGFQDISRRKCGLCQKTGHDRRTCPTNERLPKASSGGCSKV